MNIAADPERGLRFFMGCGGFLGGFFRLSLRIFSILLPMTIAFFLRLCYVTGTVS